MNADKIAKLEQKKAELERQKKEIDAKIKAVKSKELHKKRKQETHFKVLLGAFFLHITKTRGLNESTMSELKSFIDDDRKFESIQNFLNEQKI